MKHLKFAGLFLAGSLLVLAAAAPGATSARAVKATAIKPTPTPTPVALQYYEIVRMVMPSATAPPPGSFDASYRQLAALAKATPAPAPAHHGFPNLGSMIVGGAMKRAMGGTNSMQAMMAMMRDGTLERLTFYKNWVRTDLPLQHTATIVKCERHETIDLDLAKKTYRIYVDRSGCAGAPAAPVSAMSGRMGNMPNMAPGTVDMSLSAKRVDLGNKELEGYMTHGSRTTIAMTMTRATGSCRNGSSAMTIVRYISGINKWRAYCPLPPVAGAPPSSVRATLGHGGCKPHFVRNSGTSEALANNGVKLTLYRLMEMQSSGGGKVGSLLERGKIRWLYRPEAERLFSIPAGFTKAPS